MHHRPRLRPGAPGEAGMVAFLSDGSRVRVRSIRAEDADAEREFLQRLSDRSRHNRFLEQFHRVPDALVAQLTRVDQVRDAAFVATTDEDGEERIIAEARLASDPELRAAECALAVRDDWQQRGLGELLLRHLIDAARDRGRNRLYSVDACDNLEMADLAIRTGFTRRPHPDDPDLVIHELAL